MNMDSEEFRKSLTECQDEIYVFLTEKYKPMRIIVIFALCNLSIKMLLAKNNTPPKKMKKLYLKMVEKLFKWDSVLRNKKKMGT